MPVIADLVYPQGGAFVFQRPYVVGLVIGWQPGSFATLLGRQTRLSEVVFGGYQLVITLKDWVWNFDSRGIRLDEVFEDYYATEPGTGRVVSAGTVFVSLTQPDGLRTWCLQVVNPSVGDWYLFQRMPPTTSGYYQNVLDNLPQTPYWFPPYSPIPP